MCARAALVDVERLTVSERLGELFPFAAVHAATKALLAGRSLSREQAASAAVAFWQAVAEAIPSWGKAARQASRAAELRAQSVVVHGVALEALGRVGNAILGLPEAEQRKAIRALGAIDWARTAPTWEGRAVVNGRMVKNGAAVILTANAIKCEVGIDLSPEEREHEGQGGPREKSRMRGV